MRTTLWVGAEVPGLELFWANSIGEAVDLSDGWTFAVTVEQDLVETALSCTATGNATPTLDTHSSDDVATVSLVFAAGALDDLIAGPARLRVDATKGGRQRRAVYDILVGT